MCGIIGYIGKENSLEHIVKGLRALEYRGYDSAGCAFFESSSLRRIKAAGRLACLESKLASLGKVDSHCAIGHTRWATHGAPTDANSHPHGCESLMLVHNGIVENHAGLREELTALGYSFESDTDTEVAAKLLDYYLRTDSKLGAIEKMTARLRGSWALGILFADEPETIWATRKGSPLIVGIGKGESFIASDITAILASTREYIRLDEGEIAVVRADSVTVLGDGKPVAKPIECADWDVEAAERGGFDHFMLKEIHEEPEVLCRTLSPRISDGMPDFTSEKLDIDSLACAKRLHIIGCGTAMHAGLIAKELFERLSRQAVDVELASEFRSTDPLIGADDTVIVISQSGETADSLAALRLAKSKGAHTLSLVNVYGSTIARESDGVLYTLAGPEIAVASTKAYSVQTALLALLALACANRRGKLTADETRRLTAELFERAPKAVGELIARADEVKSIARSVMDREDLFFIGRGIDCRLCHEGSLKLKEVSYIHSEAYAAGELKHGTISLVETGVPVVALMTEPELREKTESNVREVKARGAIVTAIVGEECATSADRTLILPKIDPLFAFLPAATALQLLAYHAATLRGCDVDKPRNLAKSVTVE